MQLPNVRDALVPQAKITEYLLSEIHRDGKHKAAFFSRFGFSTEDWEEMAGALKQHAADYEVTRVEPSPFGQRFVVEGTMITPDERCPRVRSVWFINTGTTVPRFVTAYPVERKSE